MKEWPNEEASTGVHAKVPSWYEVATAHRCAYVLHTGSAATEKTHPMLMPRGVEEEEEQKERAGLQVTQAN